MSVFTKSEHSTQGAASPVQTTGEMITALALLAILFLLQARMLLPFLGTLLARICLAVKQQPQLLFRWGSFPVFQQPIVLHVTQAQVSVLSLDEPPITGLRPLIQPVSIPL